MDGDFNAIIHAIVERTAAEEAAMVAEVAPRLAGVTQLLLERDPEKRYQSARQVIDDLKPQRHRRGAPADVAEFLFVSLGHFVRGSLQASQQFEGISPA